MPLRLSAGLEVRRAGSVHSGSISAVSFATNFLVARSDSFRFEHLGLVCSTKRVWSRF